MPLTPMIVMLTVCHHSLRIKSLRTRGPQGKHNTAAMDAVAAKDLSMDAAAARLLLLNAYQYSYIAGWFTDKFVRKATRSPPLCCLG